MLSVDFKNMTSQNNVWVLCAILCCVVMPLDISQLGFALLGAMTYAGLQAFSVKPHRAPTSSKTKCQLSAEREQTHHSQSAAVPVQQLTPAKGGRPSRSTQLVHSQSVAVVKPDVYQPSFSPVAATKFQSEGWEAQVNELVGQIMPDPQEDKAVQQLAQYVKQMIETIIPEVEITGFAQGSLQCGRAFGVAVPEVDIVANVSPVALARRLQHRAPVDEKKLQKAAIRACADQLVSIGGFKFRRSAFTGEDPKVTLLVPSSLGFFADAVPIDFSVNSVTPLYSAALLTECGQIEPRAKALMLFVKRWAKERGICHAAKGHLSPYLWSLLVIYFMQTGVEEGPLLPPLKAFAVSSGLMRRPFPRNQSVTGAAAGQHAEGDGSQKLSIGQLFRDFVVFYTTRFNWRSEAVSILHGERAAPTLSLPLHIVTCEDGGAVEVGPSIEDPFKANNNLGTCMNSMSLGRLREELARAGDLSAKGASLAELLEPWVPPQAPETSGSLPAVNTPRKLRCVANTVTTPPSQRRQESFSPPQPRRLCFATPCKSEHQAEVSGTPPRLQRLSNSENTPPKIARHANIAAARTMPAKGQQQRQQHQRCQW
jgi:DNA polymerase sigma